MERVQKGDFKARLIPLVAGVTGLISVIGCYWIAQYYQQEPPFPGSTISSTARHYPGFLLFRIGTISGGVLFIVSYLINHAWIRARCLAVGYNISKDHPEITLVLGIMAILFLMGSTANLDTGRENSSLHAFCAANFFLESSMALMYNTYICWILVQKAGVSKTSLYIKLVLSLLCIIEIGLMINAGKKLFNAMEYSLAITLLINPFVMAWDLQQFMLEYDLLSPSSLPIQSEIPIIPIEPSLDLTPTP